MSVRNIIDAIVSGDSIAVQQSFETEMANRIVERLDVMKQGVAANMFKEHVELAEETTKIGDSVTITNAKKYDALSPNIVKGKVIGHGKDHVMVQVGTGQMNVHPSHIVKEETELNLEDYSLEELQDFMVSEDFEQLDELSKDALKSYIDQAK